MTDIKLLFPVVTDQLINQMMYAIAETILQSKGEPTDLYSYGTYYKNDVFEMRPFYWGDCTCDYEPTVAKWEKENDHDPTCYQTIFHEMHYKKDDYGFKEGHDFNDECGCVATVCAMFKISPDAPGSYVHCTCMHDINTANFLNTISHSESCEVDKPNFKHYNSGIEIEWYKYIGRDMEYPDDISTDVWINMFEKCMRSIK